MSTEKLTKSDFDAKIGGEIPVVVDFYADWCGPCRMIAPVLEELSTEYEGKVIIAKVNVDEERELAEKYKVTSIPHLEIFKKGQSVAKKLGALPKPAMKAWIDQEVSK
jgi:thioredoxin 1